MIQENLSFKISSGLKNLIGKELITNEFVAIFELVKNSFDAHAKNVKIIFENIYKHNARIVIYDDGKGMDIEDIKDKWLFVAYSAKKDGSEDEREINDYRDKLKSKRGFAGAKGVGRFSCDRLGSKLNMITIKDKQQSIIENIKVNWEAFEQDQKEEFFEVAVSHEELIVQDYPIKHGTILEIENLRDQWDRQRILKLKTSLEKLINPNQQDDEFSIEIIVDEERQLDKLQKDKRKQVNGVVKNTIFEILKIKTTKISTNISEDGEYITTILEDRGKLIYKIVEKNTFNIQDIGIELFYLSRAAKLNFTKLMGIEPVSYGSIFMFKNGFRIYPYGEVGEDPLNLDKRKAQGYKRYFGTREVVGRIEINGENELFVETTSRDGGLIKNDNYERLVEYFYEKALKRLEKYVVGIIRWGDRFEDEGKQYEALNPEDVKNKIISFIENLSNAKSVIQIEYDKDFLDIIEKRQEKSISKEISDLAKKALETSESPELHKGIEKIGKKFNELMDDRKEFEKEVEKKETEVKIKHEEVKKYKQELEDTTSQNLFLKSVASIDKKEIISLQHHINHGTVWISKHLDKLKSAIEENVSPQELYVYIQKISLENEKIATISKFVTKANFNLTAKAINNDLVNFINEYIENVYKEYEHLKINNQNLNIRIDNPLSVSYVSKFRPLEIIIVIDNLLSNSYKAGAKNVEIIWRKEKDSKIKMIYKDDGCGIPKLNQDKVFEFGFTTTDGSGLGLYHIKQIINRMHGSIAINSNIENGVEFVVEV
ncbi:ATP-binding protein [Bacillus wiedmannii]|uniref:sensor histidine kinase n=1 Tax=Bacillus wiedmannii TaxID=1890302 RepID=UPI000BF1650E|nr:ATP-binding protein [Bacillus wiedmannii]PEO09221.1 ATP-binding protein [Bacillus wiedmannii]